jgi:membrane-associated phospholipid phosphatase
MEKQELHRARPCHIAWPVAFIIAALLVLAARYYAFFPGDVSVERWVQSLVPGDLSWAEMVSKSAEFPWFLLIVGFIFVSSRVFGGWRAALLSLVSVAGMLALGKWLGPLIARPRPSPDLVHVFRPLTGYACPSLFALRYAATFGFLAVLTLKTASGTARITVPVLCAVLLALGFAARVGLAGHWPSDVMISYYLGILWAAFLIELGISTRRPPDPD